MAELQRLQRLASLRQLDLRLNPLAKEGRPRVSNPIFKRASPLDVCSLMTYTTPGRHYRLQVIYTLPQLTQLDTLTVSSAERGTYVLLPRLCPTLNGLLSTPYRQNTVRHIAEAALAYYDEVKSDTGLDEVRLVLSDQRIWSRRAQLYRHKHSHLCLTDQLAGACDWTKRRNLQNNTCGSPFVRPIMASPTCAPINATSTTAHKPALPPSPPSRHL